MYALHSEISQLASCGGVDDGELRGGVGTGGALLLAADAGGGLWRRLVLGFVLLVALLVLVVPRCARRSTGATEAGLVLALTCVLVV